MKSEIFAAILFVFTLVSASYGFGLLSYHFDLFPVSELKSARHIFEPPLALAKDISDKLRGRLPTGYRRSTQRQNAVVHDESAIMPGLTLVSGMGDEKNNFARIVNADGEVVHEWVIDWFELWPDPDHLPSSVIPRAKPGTHIHGIILMSNGDLVFNFEHLGMIRLDVCGEVIWRLPYRTHHSLHLDESGNIWASGQITRDDKLAHQPNHNPPYEDYTIVEVSPEGEIKQEFSIIDVLAENDMLGLLYLSTISNVDTAVSGDTMHLNDVETFPSTFPGGVFQRGDVMISLRNINAVLVLDPKIETVKFMTIGGMLRQHDPDFVDGNTISIFDNNNLRPDEVTESRIIEVSATDNSITETYRGSREKPFSSNIMGKHQILENGNMLITEAVKGRAFEVDSQGKIVWEYFNIVRDGVIGRIDEAQRLPLEMSVSTNEAFLSECSN